MDVDLHDQLTQIKVRKQQQKERKEKVILDYQMQDPSTQMQQLALFNTNTTFKSIEFSECIRVQAEPIQIIKIIDNKPAIYRQKDIFAPIISKRIQTQERYVFTYNFQDMNEPKYKALRRTSGLDGRRSGLNQSINQIETFIYQDEMSPGLADGGPS